MDDKTRREIDKAVEGILKDAGLTDEFQAESFFNHHYLVTSIVHKGKVT
jgi:hypothetical protein